MGGQGKGEGILKNVGLINVYLLFLRITNKILSYFTLFVCMLEFCFCDKMLLSVLILCA